MAAYTSENEGKLNETLSGLRSTLKGQLKYSEPWELQEDYSDRFSCSLEAFLSRDSLLLLTNLDEKFEENVGLLEDKVENSSSRFLRNEKERLDNEAERSPGKQPSNSSLDPVGQDEKDSSLRIAASVESKNELRLKEFDKISRGMAEDSIIRRAEKFKRRTENLKKETSASLKVTVERLKEENKRNQLEVVEKMHKDNEELKELKEKLDEKAKQHKRRLDEIYTKALMEEIHFVQQEEEKKAVLENLKGNITSLYQQILKNVDSIQKRFKEFPDMSFVDGKVYQAFSNSLSKIISEAEEVLGRSKTLIDLSVAEDHYKDMNNLIKKIMSSDQNATAILRMAEEKAALKKKKMGEQAKAEELKKEQIRIAEIEAKSRKLADSESTVKTQHVTRRLSELERHDDTPAKESDLEAARCISDKAFLEYTRLQEMLKMMQDSFKDITSDKTLSKYKFDLQKAVNVPINALSANSPSHLNDKIYRLVSLLSGNNVQVGGKNLNCNSHPQALAFCKNLVAKMLVVQGARQVSSNPESAFIYAAVIVGIWSAFPDVGKLILAHFHRSYPYLVPYYMPKQEGQSTNDYHKVLGYSIVSDKIEDEDHFLKKFSGTVQLYAAVITSSDQADHPHGIEQGWAWLARVLNLKPHPSITATMLYEFIKVAGHALMKKYGRQFQKLLLVLWKEFVPAIEEVTPPEKRGPTQRLKDFLEECIKEKKIAIPKGYLTQRWWQSGHF